MALGSLISSKVSALLRYHVSMVGYNELVSVSIEIVHVLPSFLLISDMFPVNYVQYTVFGELPGGT
jgi:hypothetical protein